MDELDNKAANVSHPTMKDEESPTLDAALGDQPTTDDKLELGKADPTAIVKDMDSNSDRQLDEENQLDETTGDDDIELASSGKLASYQQESVEETKEEETEEDYFATKMGGEASIQKDEANDITVTTIGTSEAQEYVQKLEQMSPNSKKKVSFNETSEPTSSSSTGTTAKRSNISSKESRRRKKEEKRKKPEAPIIKISRSCWEILRILVQIIWPLVLLILCGTLEIALIAAMYFRSSDNTLGGTPFRWHLNAILALLMIMTAMVVIHLYWEFICFWCKISFKNARRRRGKHDDSSTESDEEAPAEGSILARKKRRKLRSHTDQEEDETEEHEENGRDTKTFLSHVKPRTGRLLRHVCLPLFLVLIVLTEVGFLLVMPRSSFMPLVPPFGEDATIDYGEYQPNDCDVAALFRRAKDVFANNTQLDLDSVKIVYGGTAFDVNIGAKVIDNTIYMPKYTCPSVSLLVHELVHVWQEQTGYWHGKGAARRALRYLIDSRDCRECMYTYGGYEELRLNWGLAVSGNTRVADITREYGPEQMAVIVEDYFATYDLCQEAPEKAKPPVQLSFAKENLDPVDVSNTTDITGITNATESDVDEPAVLEEPEEEEKPSIPYYCQPLQYYASQILQG